MIIALLVLVVLAIFIATGFKVWLSGSDARICRQSVNIAAGLGNSDTLECPPNYDPIKKEDVKKEMGYMMQECFWKFGANEINLFEGSRFHEERFCALCNHVTFEGDARGQKITDFTEYLFDEEPEKKFCDDAKNIADCIIGKPTDPDEINDIIALNKVDIDTTKEYGIMYLYTKNTHISNIVGTIAGIGTGILVGKKVGFATYGAVIGGGVGLILGSIDGADWQSGVLVFEYDEEMMRNLNCTQMPVKQGNTE